MFINRWYNSRETALHYSFINYALYYGYLPTIVLQYKENNWLLDIKVTTNAMNITDSVVAEIALRCTV